MIKGIAFDFFGVFIQDPYHHWLKVSGLEREEKFERLSRQVDLGQIGEHGFYEGLGLASGQAAEQVATSFAERRPLNEPLLQLAKELRAAYKLALLSNSSSEYLRPLLEYYGMDIFDKVLVSAEIGQVKPQAAVFHKLLEELGLAADELVFIDDSAANTKAAAQLGIKSLTYTTLAELKRQLAALGIKI
jgi:HAD superfamily hydrolase (TIGR01509 family)